MTLDSPLTAPSGTMHAGPVQSGPVQSGPAPADPAQELLGQGYTILRDAVPEATIDALRTELAPYLERTPFCEGDFYGWQTVRVGAVLNKSRTSHALATHPAILRLADAALGAYCDWVQLNLTQVIVLHPGQPMQVPHRDQDMWHGGPKGEIEYQINVIWPLTPFTPENGGTVLWPGSHRRQGEAVLPMEESIAVAADPGDALVYLGSTLHCGGANRTAAPREGLVVSYSLGWIKSYENNFLVYPPDVARAFAPEIQDLLGYRIHRPNLGNCEGQSPDVLLRDGKLTGGAKDELLPEQAERLRAWCEAMRARQTA
ncbi:phytanoyl-CoA dioxygenase family protein [Pedomonas sp. V897]|uniref:phytanoyl-CoA dioxygenase family protein n=1 Tax=Pedomonas sp. V897 TaxID=3446482 RepID=UPI003EE2EBF4